MINIIKLLGPALLLLLGAVAGYDYVCTDELFPYAFGSSISDVEITASDLPPFTFSTAVWIILGGTSKDPTLAGESGTTPLTQQRAWIGRMNIYPSRSVQPNAAHWTDNSLWPFRSFSNTDIARVENINWIEQAYSNLYYGYFLMSSQDKQTIYLLYTNHNFEQVGQYKILAGDCSSPMPFYFGPGTFSKRDNSAYQNLVLNYDGSSLSPFFMLYFFHNGFLDDAQFTIDNGYAHLKMRVCADATQNSHCRMHAFIKTINQNNFNMAGIETHTGGELHLTMYHFRVNTEFRWSAYLPLGIYSASAGDNFPYFHRTCYTSNQWAFALTSSATLGDATLLRIQSNFYYTPTSHSWLTIPFGTAGHFALDLHCASATQIFAVVRLPTQEMKVVDVTFGGSASVQISTLDISGSSPFASGSLVNAHLPTQFGTLSTGNYILVGTGTSVTAEPANIFSSSGKKVGFLYALSQTIYDACYSTDPSLSAAAAQSIAYSATAFSISTSANPWTAHDNAHKFCFKMDPDKDPDGGDMRFSGQNRMKSFNSWCSFLTANSYSLQAKSVSAYDTKYYIKTMTNGTFETSDIPWEYNDPTNDCVTYEIGVAWETLFDNGTLISGSQFPTISYRGESNSNLYTLYLKIDVTDTDEQYLGKKTVTFWPTIDPTIRFSFDLLSYDRCGSWENRLTMTRKNNTNQVFNLFEDPTPTFNLQWNAANGVQACAEVPTFKIMIQNTGSSVWHDLASHPLATVGAFGDYPDNTVKQWDLWADFTTYPAADFMSLKGVYKFKFSGFNNLYDAQQIIRHTADTQLTIKGCKVTPSTIPTMVFQIHSASDETDTFLLWTTRDDLSPTRCFISNYSVEYISSEDGTTDIYTSWDSRLTLDNDTSTTPVQQVKITVHTAGFDNNKYGGQTHNFRIKAHVKSDGEGYEYDAYAPFSLRIDKDCSAVQFVPASYDHTGVTPVEYNMTTPERVISFEQFLVSDKWCDVVTTLEVEKMNEVTSALVLVPYADHDGVYITLAVSPQKKFSSDPNDNHTITVSDYVLYSGHEGNYTLTVHAKVLEAGGGATTSLVIELEIKHWCWIVEFLPFTTFQDQYFIEDANHPIANAYNTHPKTIPIPRFNCAFNATYSLTEQDIINECGPWEFKAEYYDPVDDALEPVDTNVYSFTITDIDALSVDVHTSNKELARSSDGNVEYRHEITAWFQHYPKNNKGRQFGIFLRDPCYTVVFEPSLLKFKTEFLTDFVDIKIYMMPYDPPQYIEFTAATDIVREVHPITGVVTTHTNTSYCGALNYTLEYRATGAPYDPLLSTNSDFNSSTNYYTIEANTTENSYNNTQHELGVAVTVDDARTYYPKSYFPFDIIIGKCMVLSNEFPFYANYTYLIGSGAQSIKLERTKYVQYPPCSYTAAITSYFENGTQFNTSMIEFIDDGIEEISFTINVNERKYEGTSRIIVEYLIDNDAQVYKDTQLQWDLILKFVKWPLDHEPPAYEKAPENIPARLSLGIEQSYSYSTGPPSEDAVGAVFTVETDNPTWAEFISGVVDEASHEVSVSIAPTRQEQVGLYTLVIELVDSGCDSQECPTEQFLCLPKKKEYKTTLIIQGDGFGVLPEEPEETRKIPEPLKICDLSSGIKACNPEIELKDINFYGLVTLKFDHQMTWPEDIMQWQGSSSNLPNSTVPDVGQLKLRSIAGVGQDPNKLGFTWKMQETSRKTVKLQVDFIDSIFISTGEKNDLLEIEVLDVQFFKSAITDAPILVDRLSGKLSSQMPLGEETLNLVSTAQQLEGGMSSTVIVNFIGNLFLSGSLQYLWGMINSLQIVFHLPAVSVQLPGNAKMIYSQFIEITQFNLLPEEILEYFYLWNYFIPAEKMEVAEDEPAGAEGQEGDEQTNSTTAGNSTGPGAAGNATSASNSTTAEASNSTANQTKDEEGPGSNSSRRRRRLQASVGAAAEEVFDKSENPNMNLADIGYGNYYLVENLETLLVLIEFYLMVCVVFFLFGLLVRLVRKTNWTRVGDFLAALRFSIGGFLFWNVPFRFLLEGYLELMIDCLINIRPFITGTASFLDLELDAEGKTNELISNMSALVLAAILLAFPFVVFHLLSKITADQLENDEELQNRVGSIFEGVKTKRKEGISFNFVFMIRRLAYAVVLVCLDQYAWVQIVLIFYMQQVMVIYLGKVKPKVSKFDNNMELFNEAMTLMISYHLLLFTDYVDDLELRYNFGGNSLIYSSYIIIGANTLLIVMQFVRKLIAYRRFRESRKNVMEAYEHLQMAQEEGAFLGSVRDPKLTMIGREFLDFAELVKIKRATYLIDLQKKKFTEGELSPMEDRHLEVLLQRYNEKKETRHHTPARPKGEPIFEFSFEQERADEGEIEEPQDKGSSDWVTDQVLLEEQIRKHQTDKKLDPEYAVLAEAVRSEFNFRGFRQTGRRYRASELKQEIESKPNRRKFAQQIFDNLRKSKRTNKIDAGFDHVETSMSGFDGLLGLTWGSPTQNDPNGLLDTQEQLDQFFSKNNVHKILKKQKEDKEQEEEEKRKAEREAFGLPPEPIPEPVVVEEPIFAKTNLQYCKNPRYLKKIVLGYQTGKTHHDP